MKVEMNKKSDTLMLYWVPEFTPQGCSFHPRSLGGTGCVAVENTVQEHLSCL